MFRILILMLFMVGFSADAESRTLKNCVPTMQINGFKTPESKFITRSNNLRKRTGMAWFAKGAPSRFRLEILDANCIPVSNAKVEIWQNDTYGIAFGRKQDPNFVGSGKAFTSNIGKAEFLSIFPGSKHSNQAPHINVRVTHEDYKPLVTKLFFKLHKMNNNDFFFMKNRDKLTKLEQVLQDFDFEDKVYDAQLILSGKHNKRFY